MRTILCCAALALVVLMGGQAQAEDGGQIPDSTLAKMGFGSLQKMTDAEGSLVRGQFAFAFSGSFSFQFPSAPDLDVSPPSIGLFSAFSSSSTTSGTATTGGSAGASGF